MRGAFENGRWRPLYGCEPRFVAEEVPGECSESGCSPGICVIDQLLEAVCGDYFEYWDDAELLAAELNRDPSLAFYG